MAEDDYERIMREQQEWSKKQRTHERNLADRSDAPSFVKAAWAREDSKASAERTKPTESSSVRAAFDKIDNDIDEHPELYHVSSAYGAEMATDIRRSVSAFTNQEKEIYKLFLKLHLIGDVSDTALKLLETALSKYFERVTLGPGKSPFDTASQQGVLEDVLLRGSPLGKQLVSDAMKGTGGWLKANDIPNSIYGPKDHHSLVLGPLEDGTELQYSGEGSLITLARPRTGKTQCHVIPNLLRYKGPCIVLDVKGECWELTSKWREDNVGPVYKFAPFEAGETANYNPLLLLSDDPNHLWEDAEELAKLLVVVLSRKDPFWETQGSFLLTAIIAYLNFYREDRYRNMSEVLDLISPAKNVWDDFLHTLKTTSEVDGMRRAGDSLAGISEGQLSGIRGATEQHINSWQGMQIKKATQKCDWTPEKLRQDNATLYICIQPPRIRSYASILRVMIGQHFATYQNAPPSADEPPVLFMLDEFPSLGLMEAIESSLATGGAYGLRFWFFAQDPGQLSKIYGKDNAFENMCAVESHMNPAHDVAKVLSERIGRQEGLFDSKSKPFASATDLAGPEYKDKIITLGTGAKPARVEKAFAANNPELVSLFGAAD